MHVEYSLDFHCTLTRRGCFTRPKWEVSEEKELSDAKQAERASYHKYIDAVKDKVKAKVSEGQRRTARHCNASHLQQRPHSD